MAGPTLIAEIPYVKNIDNEPRRRWFADDDFDLIVWYDPDGRIVGFQLCYDTKKDQRSFTWKESGTLRHDRIDDGEGNPGRYKSSPILIPDDSFDAPRVAERFMARGALLDPPIFAIVIQKLKEWRAPKPEIKRPRYWKG